MKTGRINNMDTKNTKDYFFFGNSQAMHNILDQAKKLKGHNANVLITGEGTNKALLARYVHELEEDESRPFIAINCAAIPDALIEAELFGYESGIFPGTGTCMAGKFELAQGGDIFLDEIDSLKPDLQAKLLRVLQTHEFFRVGGNIPIKLDVRVISSTSKDLANSIAGFREDLLYRLRVVVLHMPLISSKIENNPDKCEFRTTPLKEYINYLEKSYIIKIVKQNRGNISKAARILRVSRSKIYYMLGNERKELLGA